ncbi:glycosyltransferase family 39 protein [bacterium]|nr:glycosyltransferase family 39 protein [bacterium]
MSQDLAPNSRANRTFIIVLAAATAGGLGLRLWAAFEPSLSLDEALNLTYARHISLIFQQFHSPLYIAALKAWVWAFGDSPVALRLPSVLAGAAAVALMGLLGRRIAGELTGALTACLLAVFPAHVWLSDQARGHVFASTLALAAMWLWWRLLDSDEGNRADAIAFGATCLFGFLFHPLFVFLFVGMLCVPALGRRKGVFSRKDIRLAVAIPLLGGAASLPILYKQLVVLLDQMQAFPILARLTSAQLGDWIADLSLGGPWSFLWQPDLTNYEFGSEAGPGLSAGDVGSIVLALTGGVLVLVGTIRALLRRDPDAMGLLTLSYLPLGAILLVSLALPLWSNMTLMLLAPLTMLLVAYGMQSLRAAAGPVAAVLIVAVGLGVAMNADRLVHEDAAWKKHRSWDKLAGDLAKRYSGGDNLLVVPGWMSSVLEYHLERHRSEGAFPPDGPLPIVDVPFDYFDHGEAAKSLKLGIAPRTWLVRANGYGAGEVTKKIEKLDGKLSHQTQYWRLSLDLYTHVFTTKTLDALAEAKKADGKADGKADDKKVAATGDASAEAEKGAGKSPERGFEKSKDGK